MAALFALANSTDAFLLVRAREVGVSASSVPLLWFLHHVVKTLAGLPGGALSDRVPRAAVVAAGWGAYALAYVGFAFATSPWQIAALFAFYALYHGLAEGAERALVADLAPLDRKLSDNWGYVYASMYAFYQLTGEAKYRDAVRHVLSNLGKYRNYDWENGGMDGIADSIESALYLVAREPRPEALDWIESEIKTLIARQQPDGTIERWYGDGNWNRTLLLYAMMKTQGCYLRDWAPGVELGAARDGGRLYVSVHSARTWNGRVVFDYARHSRVMNFHTDYARLNEWPEWWVADENTLYRVRDADTGKERVLLGSELKNGIDLDVSTGATRRCIVERLGK